MGEFSLAHILVVGIVVMVLFGRGKVSSLMGEVGRGISSFKAGIRDGNAEAAALSAPAAEAEPETAVRG